MFQIFLFLLFTVLGYFAGGLTGINPIELDYFSAFTTFALVIGLYGSVVGIDLAAIQKRRRLAIVVITIAVPIQILATGALMWLIHPMAVSFLLAVAMTQIDPLSIDTLLRDKDKMTEEAKGILRIWASFDDPVTVLFGFLVLLPLVTEGASTGITGQEFLIGLILNLLPAAIVFLLKRYTKVLENITIEMILLLVLLVFAFFTQSFLLAAILGLLLRPIPEQYFSKAIFILYHLIVFTVGMAIFAFGIQWDDIRLAFLIAVVEFFVIQPLTSIIVFNGTPSDLLRIAFAQQNGLTTLLMGIAFEPYIHILHILLPAIIIVNLMNLIVNRIYSYKEQMGLVYDTPPDEMPQNDEAEMELKSS